MPKSLFCKVLGPEGCRLLRLHRLPRLEARALRCHASLRPTELSILECPRILPPPCWGGRPVGGWDTAGHSRDFANPAAVAVPQSGSGKEPVLAKAMVAPPVGGATIANFCLTRFGWGVGSVVWAPGDPGSPWDSQGLPGTCQAPRDSQGPQGPPEPSRSPPGVSGSAQEAQVYEMISGRLNYLSDLIILPPARIERLREASRTLRQASGRPPGGSRKPPGGSGRPSGGSGKPPEAPGSLLEALGRTFELFKLLKLLKLF